MDLLIVGAGGMGREVFWWLSQEIKDKKDYRIIGFLDDNLYVLNNYSYPVKVVGSISNYRPKANENLVLAIMDPRTKENIAATLLSKGSEFYTLIHPSAIIGNNIKIGQGCIIAPLCILTADISIGNFTFLNTNSTIGHDVTVGKYCSINGKTEITGNVKIGTNCLFGVGVSVIPNIEICPYTFVGAGSVVIRDVLRSHTTVFGNPAKEIVSSRGTASGEKN